jgi:hypothetical protein
MTVTQIAGILPALIFPAATLAQLFRLMRTRSAADISVITWVLFGVGNLAIYVYAERYTEWQAILGMLGTAVLDFVIAGVALAAIRRRRSVWRARVRTGIPDPSDPMQGLVPRRARVRSGIDL